MERQVTGMKLRPLGDRVIFSKYAGTEINRDFLRCVKENAGEYGADRKGSRVWIRCQIPTQQIYKTRR